MSLQQPARCISQPTVMEGVVSSQALRLYMLCRARFRLNIHGQSIHRGPKESHALIEGNSAGRARAAILVLARNEDCDSVLLSMQRMEHRFNNKFQYPYVFLNNAPFEAVFQERHAFRSLILHIEDISKI